MQKSKHLWECDIENIEPMDVKQTFENLNEFIKYFGHNPISVRRANGSTVLLYWRWRPSMKKAKKYNVEDVLSFFSELDDDDTYKNGDDGVPHEDNTNYTTYKDYDYLLLYMQRLGNGFFTESYKITVTDDDEDTVRQMLKKMINTTTKHFALDFI